MGLIKEPKDIDLSNQSKPWTDKELEDFRELLKHLKSKNKKNLRKSIKKQDKEKTV